jgi:hypothetical protein
MEAKNSRCLLLNADYTPLNIIDWRRALVWSIKYADNKKYGIEIIDFYKNDFIQGAGNKRVPVPSVAKTCRFFKINHHKVTFSRKNIFLRDNYTFLNLLRGNTDNFKQYINWQVLPKYYQAYPPFIKWDGIKDIFTRKWEDLPDYLLAYQSYQRLQNEYLVEKGLKSPDLLNKYLDTGFFNKLANSFNTYFSSSSFFISTYIISVI